MKKKRKPKSVPVKDHAPLGVWMAVLDRSTDVLFQLNENDDGTMTFGYRFRFYNPESKNPFDGKDKKSFWSVDLKKMDKEKAFYLSKEMIKQFENKFNVKCDGVENLDGDVKTFLEKLSQKPWAHIKSVTKKK